MVQIQTMIIEKHILMKKRSVMNMRKCGLLNLKIIK